MSVEAAIVALRSDPACSELIRDAYLTADPLDAAERFAASAEWRQTTQLMGAVAGKVVVDVGAGNGIASYAFARDGAGRVYALEPSPSAEIGRGALERVAEGLPITIQAGVAEAIPLPDGSADLVYARQVLHHVRDLNGAVRECARVLRPGGLFLACRDHVVDDERQLAAFLRSHQVHQLAGGEGAYPARAYLAAIDAAGLAVLRVLGPWDSVINAFPTVRSESELSSAPRDLLIARLGAAGRVAARVPGVAKVVRALLGRQRTPGRLYTFVAQRPA
jgi:ubiquinone/menaquinone biosynthesis C-methylase UbiE